MANTDAPFGFSPNIHQAGGCPARLGEYRIAYDYATALYSGDLVRLAGSDRNIEIVPNGTTARALGVFHGCHYVNDDGDVVWSQRWPGNALADSSKVVTCWVYDDPGLELIAQITTVAADDIGQAYEWNNGTGSNSTGRSGGYIDQAETGTPQLRIEGLAPGVDGISLSEYGADAKVRCRILTHDKAYGSLSAV